MDAVDGSIRSSVDPVKVNEDHCNPGSLLRDLCS